MYQPNLQTITKKLPETTNNKTPGKNVNKLTNDNKSIYKSAQSLIKHLFIAAVAAFTIFVTGCEDPGNLGSGFLDDDANLETRTISPGTLETYEGNSYTGRLRHMAIGRYDDPLFGEFTSAALIKPSILTSEIGTSISPDDSFKLRLVFSSDVYGDSLSTANFDIYRATEVWRGNEIRFNNQISYDETLKVGEFSVEGTETVEVELDQSWVEEYNEYLSFEGDNRNTNYRDNFPGLVIVPAEDNEKVLFARVRPASGEDDSNLNFVRFVLEHAEEPDENEEENGENGDNGDNGEDENENGNGEDDEDPRAFQTILDWAAMQSRSTPNEQPDGIIIHNTLDQLISLDPELSAERIGSKNLANVQLIFYQDQDQLEASLPEHHSRPEISFARIHLIDTQNVSDYIFSNSPNLISELNSDDYSYRFDLTSYSNSVIFSSPGSGKFYITIESINGLVFSSLLFDENAPEDLRPKINITSVKSGNE
jgi:hypothetical protein